MKNIWISTPLEKLIFALDVGGSLPEALQWVDRLRGHVGAVKIGKEAFVSHGPALVEAVLRRGTRVFLDLKFHDIPNTVARAAEAAVELGVHMFNVHAQGGRKMMAETVAAVGKRSEQKGIPPPVVLAVTVLTSLDDQDLREVGYRTVSAAQLTLDLAKIAQDSGISGVVASPRDVEAIRRTCGNDFIIVTPGIRESAPRQDDQRRVLTSRDAVRLGADCLVVGRPIRLAPDPVRAAEEFLAEIREGLAQRITRTASVNPADRLILSCHPAAECDRDRSAAADDLRQKGGA